MATFSDDFNRANSDSLGADWTEFGGCNLRIYSNQVRAADGASGDGGIACNKVETADHYAQVIWLDATHTNYQIGCRGATATSVLWGQGSTAYGYHVEVGTIGGSGGTLYRCVAGTWTSLGSAPDTGYSAGQVARIQAVGSTITYSRNGTTVREVTDTNVTSGTWTATKFNNQNSGVGAFDDWQCGDIGVTETRTPAVLVVSPRRSPQPGSVRIAVPMSAVVPATASGTLALGGTVAASGAVTASGSVALAGSGASAAPATASGSLTLAGTGTSAAPATAAGSLTLGGSATAAGVVTASGSVTLAGTAGAGFAAAPVAPLVVTRRGPARQHLAAPYVWVGAGVVEATSAATASGSLTLGGTVAAAGGAATAAGSIALDGTAAAAAPVTANGGLTLGGSATVAAPVTAAGGVSLDGAAAAAAPVTAAGGVSLDGVVHAGVIALGSLTLGGTATPSAAVTTSGALNLTGATTATVDATPAGSITLDGSASGAAVTVATGTLTLDGWAALAAQTAAVGLLALAGTAGLGPVPQRGTVRTAPVRAATVHST